MRPTEPVVAADAGAAPAAIVASRPDGGHAAAPRVRVAPCTDADQKARVIELGAISAGLRNEKADARALLADLRAALTKPCLAHVAPTMTLPKVTSVEVLRRVWDGSLHGALLEASEGLRSNRGQQYLVIPPGLLPELPDAARKDLASMICALNDSSCDRSASYVMRSHEAFDAMARAEASSHHVGWEGSNSWFVEVSQVMCTRDVEDGHPAPKTFEMWASCAASQAPKNRRYAESRLRAPERGWLFLRGRRGHYEFADEVRAYDLATGAAYVARNEGGLVLGGHDFAAQRGTETMTGQVAPDHVRELAFALLTRKAIVKVRTDVSYAAVPAGVPLSLAPPSSALNVAGWGELSWASSAQTQLAWTYTDPTRGTRASGDFTWPSSSDWVEEHIDGLVRIAEAGLVKGCAPAKLPAPSTAAPGRVSSIDVDPAQHQALNKELEARLESLRPRACAGAK